MNSPTAAVITVASASLIVIGLLFWSGGLGGSGGCRGHRIERETVRVYLPMASMLLVSVVLSWRVYLVGASSDGPPGQKTLAFRVIGVWTAIGLAFATSTYAMYSLKGAPLRWGEPLFWALSEWYLWAASLRHIFWLARAFPSSAPPSRRHLPLHLGGVPRRPRRARTAYVLIDRATGSGLRLRGRRWGKPSCSSSASARP